MTGGLPWVTLAASAGAVLVAALAGFATGTALRRHNIADVAWGLGFALVTVVSLLVTAGHGQPARRALLVAATLIWGLRLAAHIARRGRGRGEDPRYEQLLRGHGRWYPLGTVYLSQGALIWLISLPVQLGMLGTLGGWAQAVLLTAGGLLWACGLFFEAVGDWQLERFKADPAHRGQIMDRGLWRYTRHPNYFGDACVWWGIFLIGLGSWAGLATVISPLVMTWLLVWGSGKRLTEQRMIANRPGYAGYAARTSGFIPWPPRPGR